MPYGEVLYGEVPYGEVPYGEVPYGREVSCDEIQICCKLIKQTLHFCLVSMREFHGENQPKCQIGELTQKHPTLNLQIHGSTALRQNALVILYFSPSIEFLEENRLMYVDPARIYIPLEFI